MNYDEEFMRDFKFECEREEREEKYRETHPKICDFCDNKAEYKYNGDYYCEDCFEIEVEEFKSKNKMEEDYNV